MKRSELKETLRGIVSELVSEIIEKKIHEVVMKQIGEVYIRSLVENTVNPNSSAPTRRQQVVEEVEHDEPDPLPAKRTRSSNLQALIPPTSNTRKAAPATKALLARDNPMRDIYEGTQPLAPDNDHGGGTMTNIPLEDLGVDLNHMRKLSKRLMGG